MQGFSWDQLKCRVSLTVLTYPVHKGSTNYWLFPYSFRFLNRGGELLLVMKTRVTKADVLLRGSEVSGLFLDFQGQMHLLEMSWSGLVLSVSSCAFCPRHAAAQMSSLPRIPKSSGRYHSPLGRETHVL